MGTYAKSVGPSDLYTLTFVAEGAITEGNLVKLGSAQTGVLRETAANSRNVIGVAQKTGVSGDNIPVRVLGISTVVAADGSIAAGDLLVSSSAFVTVTTATSSVNQNVIGRALGASNASGDKISMLLLFLPGITAS